MLYSLWAERISIFFLCFFSQNLPISPRHSECCRCLGVEIPTLYGRVEKKIFSFVSILHSHDSGGDCVNLRRIFPTLSTDTRRTERLCRLFFTSHCWCCVFCCFFYSPKEESKKENLEWNRKTVRQAKITTLRNDKIPPEKAEHIKSV